ncbi:MAG: HNH endonuclease, partial [Gemmatimonadales bacterium]
MRAFVAVTDNDWFDFLSSQPDLDEVNFWTPSGKPLANLSVGAPVLFKLHAPLNFVTGGGFFAHFSLLPASLAWETFREKNGAESLGQMRERIGRYRREVLDPHLDYHVGCAILVEPFFLDRRDWISVPRDFSLNVVRGKSYDLTKSPGRDLWEEVLARRRGARRVSEAAHPPMFGDAVPVRPRLGPGAFRVLVTDTYRRRCAVTREKALPVLEAAHIRPVAEGGRHEVENGLLLRSDLHRLFDRGYVTVTPDYRVRVSSRLRDDFDNGEHYLQMNESSLWLPSQPEKR